MIMRDLCENSVFLTEEQKEKVNKKLDKHFKSVAEEFKRQGIKGNLYYTGSLSRKEPAIEMTNGDLKLASDIDFILIIENEEERNKIKITEKYLNRLFPEYDNTLIIIKKEDYPHLKSFIGKDLLSNIDFPVYKAIDLEKRNAIRIGGQDYFDLVVYQMTGYFLHPEKTGNTSSKINYRNSDYHKVKLSLECLRMQSFNNDMHAFGLNSAYKNRYAKCFEKVSSPKLIEQLVMSRELSKYDLTKGLDIIHMLKTVIGEYLRTRYGLDDSSLIDLVKRHSLEDKGLKNLFHCGIIAYAFAVNEKDTIEQKKWFELFKQTLALIDRKEVKVYKKLDYILQINFNSSRITENKLLIKDIAAIMSELRLDFINALSRQNLNKNLDKIEDLPKKLVQRALMIGW